MNKLTEDILEITPEARDKLEDAASRVISTKIAAAEELTRALNEILNEAFDELEKEQDE